MTEAAGQHVLTSFVLTAAGSGTRMGGGGKKEFRTINGLPVLAMAVRALLDSGIFDFGLITHPEGLEEQTRGMLYCISESFSVLKKPLLFCTGGRERQDSVRNGLKMLESELPELYENGLVLIHDGARPWLDPFTARSVAEAALIHGGAAPVVPSVDAMKQIDDSGYINSHLKRAETVSIQTPQGFSFRKILEAHRKAESDGHIYIDDTEIFSRYCGRVFTVNGTVANRKITYLSDLEAGA